jgi:16S rRNA (guanine966-N2)-methyltransferase
MRIVGGALSGRKIEPPLSRTTRPMMDRVREALFNILAHRDWGQEIGDLFGKKIHVLDAFCGTGALAFEALSRGAGHATLFDKDVQALSVAQKNAAAFGLMGRCVIQPADALLPPRANESCRLVFLAPPYRKGLIPPALAALDQAGWIAPHAVLVAETGRKEELPAADGFILILRRFYGDTALHFFVR